MKRALMTLVLVLCAAPVAAQQQNTGLFSRLWLDKACTFDTGSGSPEGAKTGKVCDLYLRTDGASGTVLYLKESGTNTTTGWTAYGAGGGGTTAHTLLSSTHTDATANAAVRGAIIVGQTASPKWSRLTPSVSGSFLRFDGTDTIWSLDGATLTSLSASNLASGTVPTARLGSGTANSTTFLRGDGTWADPTITATVKWNGIAAPDGNLSIAMAAYTSTLTWNSATSTGNLFQLRDGGSNTGTGYMLDVGTASASSVKPLRIQAKGSDALTVDSNGDAVFGGQYYSAEHDAGNSGTALTIDWRNGNQQTSALTGNVTLTLSNPVAGGRYLLVLTQDATGSRTVTWPAAVKWSGGVAPTLTTTANKSDICTLAYTAAQGGIYVAACNLNY